MPMDDAREQLLARYLDGSLSGEALDAFERRLSHDAALRADVESLRALDVALQRNFATGSSFSTAQILALAETVAAPQLAEPMAIAFKKTGHAIQAARAVPSLLQRIAVAAAVVAGVVGVWLVWQQVKPDPTRVLMKGPPPITTAASYYEHKIIQGFTPHWTCKDDAQFTDIIRDRFGIGLTMAAAPGVTLVGVDYMDIPMKKTVGVLGNADGKPILVLVNTLERDDPDRVYLDCANLFVHRREIGPLVLYELNSIGEPRMLNHFRQVD